MMSLSFMIRSSSPSILTSLPDHLPNSTRSPALTSAVEPGPSHRGRPVPRDDLALIRLLLRGVGTDAATGSPLVLLDTAYDHAVVQRTKLHD